MLEGPIEFSTIKLSELDGIGNRIDAEFYQRKHLLLEKKMKMLGSSQLSTSGVKLDCSAFYPSITDFYNFEGKGVPFLRVNEIQNGLVKTTEGTAFLPESILDANQSTICRASPFDIIIAKGGNSLAKLGLVPEDYKTYALSRDLIALKTDGLMRNKYFVWLFLHCDFGQSLLWRTASQTGQPHLTLPSISALNIPIFSEAFEVIAEKLYRQSEISQSRAVAAYGDAESLLLSTISMADFLPKAESINIKSFKDSFGMTGRLDAEHYQPKYEALYKALAKSNCVFKLGDCLTFNQRGMQPDYAEEGLPVVNSKHVQRGHVNMMDNRFAAVPDNTNAAVIKQGDVLMNGTGVGTIGRAAPYWYSADALPDNHVTVLRTEAFSPICLALYINSIAGQYQVDQHFKGSSGQIELYPTDIANFWCPELDKSIQQQIDKLAQQSFTLKAKSERLLEAAKRAVEIAIEQDEAAGMAYLAREGALT